MIPVLNRLKPRHQRALPFLLLASSATASDRVTYQDDVLPVLREHCLSCHHAGEAKGGLAMDSYAALIEGGGSGEVVFDDGDVDGSRLWQLASHEDEPVMPPGGSRMPDDALAILRRWIEQGAAETEGSPVKKTQKAAAFDPADFGDEIAAVMPPEDASTEPVVVVERSGPVVALAAAPAAPLVAVGGQSQITLRHADDDRVLAVWAMPDGADVSNVRFSGDGRFLAAAGGSPARSGVTAAWSIEDGRPLPVFESGFDVAIDADVHPGSDRVIAVGPDGRVRRGSLSTGSPQPDLEGPTDWGLAAALSFDATRIAVGDRAGGVFVWDAATGVRQPGYAGSGGPVHAVAWRRDGALVTGGGDGTVRLWAKNRGDKPTRSIKVGSPVRALAVAGDGRIGVGGEDDRFRVYGPDGKKAFEHTLGDDVLSVASLADGRWVVGDWTGTVSVIDPKDPSTVRTYPADPQP